MTAPLHPLSLRRRGRTVRYDAIVVGSGVGGAVTAGLLARHGRRVLVLEKNESVGGILASYTRGGFKIDAGSHLVSRGARGPLGQTLRLLGLDRPRFLTHPIPVRSRGIFSITAPEHRRGLLGAARQAILALEIPGHDVRRLAALSARILTARRAQIAAWDRITLDALVRSYTEHPGAYFLLSFLASIFFVLPPWEVAAGEAALCLRSVLRDYALSYVEGGMDAFIDAVLAAVPAASGDVVVGSRVVSIAPGAGGLHRVATEAGDEHEAPVVACNLAPADLVRLVAPGALPLAWIGRARAVRPSGNACQVKLALRRPLLDEGCLIGGLSVSGIGVRDLTLDLFRRTVASLDEGRITDPLPVYAPVPTNFDPTLAPPGCQLVVASIYGSTRDHPVDPPERWKAAALRALATVIPGLEDELLFHEFTSIPAIGAWMGKRTCAAISNGQVPGQVGADRLPVATPLPGLYLCGDGAGGRGVGTELAADSAMEVVRQVLEARP